MLRLRQSATEPAQQCARISLLSRRRSACATAVKIQTPVRVGLAFAPTSSTTRETFTENQKQELLQRLATKFATRKGIESIEIIPGNYINPKGGFDELDRLRASFRINQVVLLSYDQVQFSESGGLSLTYWVTYGAGVYVVKGEKNETRTMMDAVVYDIPSRTMLFHAVGQNSIKGSSTLSGLLKPCANGVPKALIRQRMI